MRASSGSDRMPIRRAALICRFSCLLGCAIASLPSVPVPSPDFPSLAAAIDAMRETPDTILVLEDGQHDVGATPLLLRHPLHLRAKRRSYAQEQGWATRLRGSLDMDGAVSGTFKGLSIENQRSREMPDASVCVMEVIGGRWDMTLCQIAGAGTGCKHGALVELGGEPAASTSDLPHSFRSCNSPTLTLRQCCVRSLRPDEIEVDVEKQEVEHLIFAGGNSTLIMEDTLVHGGVWYALHMFDRACVRMLRCCITGADTAMAVEDIINLDMRSCLVRENNYVFHVYSPYPRFTSINNTFIGVLFEDMDRFTNASMIEGETVDVHAVML